MGLLYIHGFAHSTDCAKPFEAGIKGTPRAGEHEKSTLCRLVWPGGVSIHGYRKGLETVQLSKKAVSRHM
jgi:hypothetical protein